MKAKLSLDSCLQPMKNTPEVKISVYPKVDHFSKKKGFSRFQIGLIAMFHLRNVMKKD